MAYAAMELYTSTLHGYCAFESKNNTASGLSRWWYSDCDYLYMSNNATQNFRQICMLAPHYESLYMEEQFPLCNAITVDSYPHLPILQAHPGYTPYRHQSSYSSTRPPKL